MKRCPHCGRTYSDESYNFCLQDGQKLSTTVSGEATLVLPDIRGNFDSTLQDQPQADNRTKTKDQLYLEYWSALFDQLSRDGSVVKLGPAKSHFEISAQFAHPKVRIFTRISLTKNIVCSGIRTLNQKELFSYLANGRKKVERDIEMNVLHPALDFHWRAARQFQNISEFTVCFLAPINDPNSWERYLVWHKRTLVALDKIFYKRVRQFDPSQPLVVKPTRPAQNPFRIVNRFWKGFESNIRDAKDLTLNRPSISSSPFGKSSMSKTYQGFRFAVQIHPARDSADVNVTVGQSNYLALAKLHKNRASIHKQLRKKLEWKLNATGESWALVSRDFQITEVEQWEPTYDWLKKNLRLFLKVLLPRIQVIQSRIEKQNKR